MTKKTGLNPGEKKLADQDYWSKLSDEQKEWLNQFNQEYYQGIYNEKNRKIHTVDYDRDLKDARNARIKDITYMNLIDDKFAGDQDAYENVNDDKTLFSKTRIQKIGCCFDTTVDALAFLRSESLDIIINDDESVNEVLLRLQKDTIAIVEFMRKNP